MTDQKRSSSHKRSFSWEDDEKPTLNMNQPTSMALRSDARSASNTSDSQSQQQQARLSQAATINRVSSPPSQAPNFSTRFASSHYGSPVEAASTSPTSQSQAYPNPFTEHTSRSRSSTINNQPYPPPISGALPINPPPQPPTESLNMAPHQSRYGPSRPVSRSADTVGHRPNHLPTSSSSSNPRPPSSSTTPTSRSPFSTPITSPPRPRPFQILLINPNSTLRMTDAMLHSIRHTLPSGVELVGYTAPYPAPTAIESITDSIMSTEACLRDLAKYAASNGETVQNYDGMVVACYSKHPLIEALRESYDVPIIGIMEASLYTARMLGGRFGIVGTGLRSRVLQEDAVRGYGLEGFYVGSEAMGTGVLELGAGGGEVGKRVALSCRALVAKGADTILLGCAGMTELVRAAKDAVRDEDGRRTVNIVDGVEAGVQVMCALVALGVPTSKKGVYKGEREGRRNRGQNWL